MSELPKKLVINQKRTDIGFLDEMGLFNHIQTLELATEILHRYDCYDDLVDVVRAVKQRIHFIGLSSEPKDWAKEVALIEAALAKVRSKK